jgi:hypothetical protein
MTLNVSTLGDAKTTDSPGAKIIDSASIFSRREDMARSIP